MNANLKELVMNLTASMDEPDRSNLIEKFELVVREHEELFGQYDEHIGLPNENEMMLGFIQCICENYGIGEFC